jgi:predicted amidohydrolase
MGDEVSGPATPGRPIEPYQVVALSPAIRHISCRSDIMANIAQIERLLGAAMWSAGLQLPAKLVTIPEGALQGFPDEIRDTDHEQYAAECAIEIPGPETDRLAEICARYGVFLMATAKALHAEFPRRFFNVGFVISPEKQILLKHHKVVPLPLYEKSLTPHSVWDKWVELYGRNLDAFYPVADTAIGRLGFIIANEAAYPENARGLAVNGCEIAYRGPYPSAAFAGIQNRARALDNNMYVIGSSVGPALPPEDQPATGAVDTSWRHSMVVDYTGRVVAEMTHGGAATFLAATIDVEGLRDYRIRSPWGTWLKDLTTEQYMLIYENPIFPRNLWLSRAPVSGDEYRAHVLQAQVQLMIDRGIWRRPSWSPAQSETEIPDRP